MGDITNAGILAGQDCTYPQVMGLEHYVCTRGAGHFGPCAAVPIDEADQGHSKPVTVRDIAAASGIALVVSFVACLIWYAMHAV